MPRKSSTNTRALSTRINNIKAEINPIPRAGRTSVTPKPMRSTTKIYVQRKVRLVKAVPATGASATITYGDIIKALGMGNTTERVPIQVDRVSAWNVTCSGTSTNYLSILLGDYMFNAASAGPATASLVGPYEDYGAGGNPPSVTVNVPRTLSNVVDSTGANTSAAITIEASPFGLVTIASAQTIIVDVWVNVAF